MPLKVPDEQYRMRLFCGADASMQMRILPRNYCECWCMLWACWAAIYRILIETFRLTDERQPRCERADHDDGGIEMTWKRIVLAICALACCTFSCLGQDLGKVSRAEDIGFSTERLVRITRFFQSDVDKGAIPGAVVLVARDGKLVYQQTVGYQDREKRIAMKPDAIFRIASMTKPITSVAVMMLAEEGKIDLIAPVAQYLPEFKDVKVGVEKTDGNTGKTALTFEDPKRQSCFPRVAIRLLHAHLNILK